MKPGFLRRLFDAFFPAVVPVPEKAKIPEPAEPAATSAPPEPPRPLPPSLAALTGSELKAFAVAQASFRAALLGSQLQVLAADPRPESQAAVLVVRARAIEALEDLEKVVQAAGEDRALTADHVGAVMVEVVKARLKLGVAP